MLHSMAWFDTDQRENKKNNSNRKCSNWDSKPKATNVICSSTACIGLLICFLITNRQWCIKYDPHHLPALWHWSLSWRDQCQLCWRPGQPHHTVQTSSGCPECTPHCLQWPSSPQCCTGRYCPGRSLYNRSDNLGSPRSAVLSWEPKWKDKTPV